MNKTIPTPLAILIILLVIAAIIGVTLWICPEKEAVPPQDETANWKTYKNEEYGFEIKYPTNCVVRTDCTNQTDCVYQGQNTNLYIEFQAKTQEDFDICTGGFSVRKNEEGLPVKQWLQELYNLYDLKLNERINPYGIVALEVLIDQNEEFSKKFACDPLPLAARKEIEYEYCNGTNFWITGNEKWIYTLFHFQDGSLLEDQMLSTFRFLE